MRVLVDLLLTTICEHARPGDRLLRVSVTTPGGCGAIAPFATRYVRELPANESALLLADRREDASEHAYGLLLTARANVELTREWCALTGAALRGQLAGSVGGWARWTRTGDASLLREHLERVVSYAMKPWPPPVGERGAGDVFGCGVLEAAWRVASERAGAAPQAALEDARTGRRGVTACGVCGISLAGRRTDALYCSTRHRVAAYRARRRARGAS